MSKPVEILVGDPGTWITGEASMDADLSDEKWFRNSSTITTENPGTVTPSSEEGEIPPRGDPPNLEDRPPAGTNLHEWAAGVLVEAWQNVLGTTPSPQALQMAQAIAKGESTYGWPKNEGWAGHHNWGAVHAVCRDDGVTRNCQKDGGCVKGFMSTDRYDGVKQPTCFAHFETNVDGASHFLTQLLVRRPAVAAVIDSGDAFQVALAMRRTSYFMTCKKCKDDGTFKREAAVYAGMIYGAAKTIAAARKVDLLVRFNPPPTTQSAKIDESGSWPRDVTDLTDYVSPSETEPTFGPVSGLLFGVGLGLAGVWGYKRYNK